MRVLLKGNLAVQRRKSVIKPCVILCIVFVQLAGCTSPTPSGADNKAIVGSDRDEHGCIGSAGYSWCAHTQACERSWELANRAGFDNTQEAFDAFCGVVTK